MESFGASIHYELGEPWLHAYIIVIVLDSREGHTSHAFVEVDEKTFPDTVLLEFEIHALSKMAENKFGSRQRI